MTKAEALKCHGIIHLASLGSGGIGAGLAQIPLADSVPISGIQITMIVSLGKVFHIKISKTVAKAAIAAFASSYVGRGISQAAVGWIPIAGNAINATTAAGLTEAMGWFMANQFSKSSSQEDFVKNISKETPAPSDGQESSESEREDPSSEKDDTSGADDMDILNIAPKIVIIEEDTEECETSEESATLEIPGEENKDGING